MTMTKADDEVEAIHQPKQPHLAKQDATTVDPTKLTALSPEVVGDCWCFLRCLTAS